MERKRQILRMTASLLCILLCMTCLSGCKYSAKLHELVQDRYEHLLSLDSAQEFINDENSEDFDDDLAPLQQEEQSERRIDDTPSSPVAGDAPKTSEPAKALTPKSTAQRTARSNPVPSGSPSGSSGNATDAPSSSVNPSSGTQAQGEGSGGSGDNGYTIEPGNGPVRQIVDARGETVEVPEKVSSVAASGDVASLLCLVGGEGLIKATSENFRNNRLISDAQAAGMQALWAGSGYGMMGGSEFASLLALKPEVCVELSGHSSFSEEQLAGLIGAGIAYVVLPALDSPENIQTAVSLCGQLVGDRTAEGGVNGMDLAAQYASYSQSLLSSVASAAQSAGTSAGFQDINASGDGYYNGKYAAYVRGWDASAAYQITFNGNVFVSGTGAAYTGNHNETGTRLMSSLMSIAGLESTMEIKNRELASYVEYVSPVVPTREKLSVQGASATKVNNNRLFQYDEYGLGDEHFPAVIVDGSDTAAAMRADPLWAVYSLVSSGDGAMQVNGFTTSDGSMIGSSVIAPYDILVSPEGLGAWSHSGESVLEPMWLAWRCYGAYSEADVLQEVRNFYSTFYRISLTDEQASWIVNR